MRAVAGGTHHLQRARREIPGEIHPDFDRRNRILGALHDQRRYGHAGEVAAIVVTALVLSFLATLYPAWKAASTDPVQVLRYE